MFIILTSIIKPLLNIKILKSKTIINMSGKIQFLILFIQSLLFRSSNSLEWALSSPPKPHAFVSLPMQSCLENISEIVSSLNQMLPQLTGFIEQFHNVVKEFDVNVITDSFGNMSVDVPADMSDIQAKNVSKRLGIIDKLINSHGTSINDLFQKG